MTDSISFFIPGKPVAKARPRFAHRGPYSIAYRPKDEILAEELFRCSVREIAAKTGMTEPIPRDAPVRLSCEFYFSPPASWSKKKRAAAIGTAHTQKPDLDNLLKFAEDALNGILWNDDRQVCEYGACFKRWAEEPGTRITVEIAEDSE